MKTEQGIIVQSLARAFEILECFNGYEVELSIKELSERMSLSKSTVYGLVNTLAAFQYLEQNSENKRYRLGIKLFELGMLVQRRIDLQIEAKPHAKKLSEKYSSVVHLAVLFGDSIIYIDKVDTPGAIIMYSQVGKLAPCYCTGVGKAIAAFLPADQQDRLLRNVSLESFTESTLVAPDAIRKEWEITNQRGYAVDNEEIEIGLRCIAAPIFGPRQKPVAAISVSSPSRKLPAEMDGQVAADVMGVAKQISYRLGYRF